MRIWKKIQSKVCFFGMISTRMTNNYSRTTATNYNCTNHDHLYFSSSRSVFTDNVIEENDFCQLHGEVIFITARRKIKGCSDLDCCSSGKTQSSSIMMNQSIMIQESHSICKALGNIPPPNKGNFLLHRPQHLVQNVELGSQGIK